MHAHAFCSALIDGIGVKTQDSEAIKLDLAMEEAADTGTCSRLSGSSPLTPVPNLPGSDSDGDKPPAEPRKPSLRIYERKRKSEHVMFQCNTLVEDDSLEPTRAGEKESRRFVITRSSTMQATRQGSFSFADARKPRRVFSFDHLTLKGVVASAFGVFKRCGEPDSMFEVECDGWCKPRTRKTKAHVVCRVLEELSFLADMPLTAGHCVATGVDSSLPRSSTDMGV